MMHSLPEKYGLALIRPANKNSANGRSAGAALTQQWLCSTSPRHFPVRGEARKTVGLADRSANRQQLLPQAIPTASAFDRSTDTGRPQQLLIQAFAFPAKNCIWFSNGCQRIYSPRASDASAAS
jgi:hypothetical protein